MTKEKRYDIIIVGAGAAGLSLAVQIANNSRLSHMQTLIIDKERKNSNDRTWCYWEEGEGKYDHLINHSWKNLEFKSQSLEKSFEIAPYTYKMLRSKDFYGYAFEVIDQSNHVHFIKDEVKEIDSKTGAIFCETSSFIGNTVFSSKVDQSINFDNHFYTGQHFGGWFVEYEDDTFDPRSATFMDFRIDQNGESRFLYVLPTSARKALVEVAIFSNNLMKSEDYDQINRDYLNEYISDKPYKVLEREYGVIPMTNYPFWKHNEGKLFHIGTAGGAVKPSSGYAFSRIQEHTDSIIDCLDRGVSMASSYNMFRGRHLLFDSIMLHVLEVQQISGAEVFTDLFQHVEATKILKFLEGKSTFLGELPIFGAPTKWPFIKGLFKSIKTLR